jgi:VanZ family protein
MKTILRQSPLTILLALAIWVVCLIPVPETPLNEISFIDKWTHFVMYAALTVVLLYEYRRASGSSSAKAEGTTAKADGMNGMADDMSAKAEGMGTKAEGMSAKAEGTAAGNKKSNSSSTWLLLLPISQGCLVELAQAYLTTCRSGDWFDALCNTLGVLIGAGIGKLIIKK